MSISTQGIAEYLPIYKNEISPHEVKKPETETSCFLDWLNDKDKVCTDGKDDGSLSLSEGLESFGKGFLGGLIKDIINHPKETIIGLGVSLGLIGLTGGAILPAMTALGGVLGAGIIGAGIYGYASSENDADAKRSLETAGKGTLTTFLSIIGMRPALNAAAKAGVNSAQGAKDLSIGKVILQTFKSIPESLKMSGLNAKGNILTWTTKTIHAHSNALQGADTYMSKPNDVQAYRFNPNGTPDEILTNNPGVFRGADGKYYVPNKYSPNEPYLIDPSKEQMIMLYGGDDMAVCDGAIFKGSYVNQAAFKANGTKAYVDPTKVEYGQVINVTKQAPGGFKILPKGTKIKTLEGLRTVKEGEIVALDHAGNPYATTVKNVIKRNTNFTPDGLTRLHSFDPVSTELAMHPNGTLSKIPEPLRKDAVELVLKDRNYVANLKRINNEKTRVKLWERGLNGFGEGYVKMELLNKHGITLEIIPNDYNGIPIFTGRYIQNGQVLQAPKEFRDLNYWKFVDLKLEELGQSLAAK